MIAVVRDHSSRSGEHQSLMDDGACVQLDRERFAPNGREQRSDLDLLGLTSQPSAGQWCPISQGENFSV
jgi:hypothetical protein